MDVAVVGAKRVLDSLDQVVEVGALRMRSAGELFSPLSGVTRRKGDYECDFVGWWQLEVASQQAESLLISTVTPRTIGGLASNRSGIRKRVYVESDKFQSLRVRSRLSGGLISLKQVAGLWQKLSRRVPRAPGPSLFLPVDSRRPTSFLVSDIPSIRSLGQVSPNTHRGSFHHVFSTQPKLPSIVLAYCSEK